MGVKSRRMNQCMLNFLVAGCVYQMAALVKFCTKPSWCQIFDQKGQVAAEYRDRERQGCVCVCVCVSTLFWRERERERERERGRGGGVQGENGRGKSNRSDDIVQSCIRQMVPVSFW